MWEISDMLSSAHAQQEAENQTAQPAQHGSKYYFLYHGKGLSCTVTMMK